jgi:DNA-binding NtrC family response regulator
MRRVLDDVARIAGTREHVLICGEQGTGRQLVAREIHRRTAEGDRPFVTVTCITDSADELEFDLFGQSSQAAGRTERRALERIGRSGLVHQALGGTLFFANVPDIPSTIQLRLANLLRAGAAVVMYGKHRIELNVRAMAAVEQGYNKSVSDRRIHPELLQVLSAARVDLPPLRLRGDDIPALAAFLLTETCRHTGVAPKQLTKAALQLMSAFPWHGNGIELQRLLTELVNRMHGEIIDLTDVLGAVQIDGRANPFARGGTLREARARFEREYIAAVMAQHHGRIPDAAKTLGVQRPNLYRKLRRLNVPMNTRRSGARR